MSSDEASEYRIDLRPAPDAAGVARHFVHEHSESLPAELVQDAELLVSELVTNAVRHGQPGISLTMRLDPLSVGIAVHDDGQTLPPTAPDPPPADAIGGRGLMIVDQVSSEWGVEPSAPPPGKTVWFKLDKRAAD